MIYKKLFLIALLIPCCISIKAEKAQNFIEVPRTEKPTIVEAAEQFGVNAAEIEANAKIESAQIITNAGIEISKQWSAIIGTAVCIFALTQLASILK